MIKFLTRRNQLNELEDLQHRLGSSFSHSPIPWHEDHDKVVRRIPLVDISEDPQGYLITAELPEVKKEDVKVTMDDDGTLTITGDREFEENCKQDHRVERVHGCFLHRYSLPADARPAKISVEFRDGVLQVRLAKNERDEPRQVEVDATAYYPISNQPYSSSGWGINE